MKRLTISSILISLFIWFFILPSNVKAATFEGNGRDLKFFDSNNAWFNFASATSFTGYNASWNSEYGVYYTSQALTTGTYGGAFGGTITLVPGQYYNILYATSKPGTCGKPNDWNTQFKASSSNNSSATQRAVVDRAFVSPGYVTYTVQGDYFDACYYAVTFHVTQVTSTLILPFNSSGSTSGTWTFWGFNLENLGSIDSLTQDDLTNMQNSLQNSINTMSSNIINNQNTNTQNIINNQNQNQAQAHQDAQNTQNTIKDDNVNSNTGKNFFDNFSDNTHGLSGIVTAPLNMINGLVNVSSTSCSDLTGTYENQSFTIPCGKLLWGHTGISQFNDFYNLVVGGALCYWIIRDLFLTIEALKDPDNDKVEVMSL